MLNIASAVLTPAEVSADASFVISISVSEIDTSWNDIKEDIDSWNDLKNNYTTWKQVKQR